MTTETETSLPSTQKCSMCENVLCPLLNEEYASNLFRIDVEVKFPFQETLHLPLEIVKLHRTIKNSNVVSYFTQNM